MHLSRGPKYTFSATHFSVLLVSIVGCSDGASSDPHGDSEQLIWGGTPVTDYPAAVSLGCSGALIAQDTILTAAHCMSTRVANGGTINLNAWVMKDGVKTTISNGKEVRVRWDPHYAGKGSGDAASDIAVLTLTKDSSFDAVTPAQCTPALREDLGKPSCYMRIHADDLATTRYLTIRGSGPNSNTGSGAWVMRSGSLYVDDWSSDRNAIWTKAGSIRVCSGDSGAGLAGDKNALRTKYEMLVATHSTSPNKGDSGECADEGTIQKHNRTGTKIWLINEALAERGRSCTRLSGTDYKGRSYNYYKCW